MFIPCSATYFLELGACLSLKLATKQSFRDKKNYVNLDLQAIFLKQKRRSATKKIEVSLKNLECSCLAQKHIFRR